MLKFISAVKTETSVGLLILTGIGLLIYSSVVLTGWNADKQEVYRVSALLDNVTGLSEGTAVRMAGIKIGEVENITLESGKARVWLIIYRKYELRRNSEVAVKSLGILGDKYLEITAGSEGFELMQDNETLTLVRRGSDLDSLVENLSGTLDDIRQVTGALRQSVGGDEGADKINRIMENIEQLTYSLRLTTEKTNERIDGILQNIDAFSANLNQITGDNKDNISQMLDNFLSMSADLKIIMAENRLGLNRMVENLAEVSGSLREDLPEITGSLRRSLNDLETASANIDSSFANVSSITQKIDRGEGTVGQLINDRDTVEKLNKALDDLGGFLDQANKLKFDIDFNTAYYNRYKDYKSAIGLNIYPNRYHTFSVQLVDDPQGRASTKTVRTTQKNADGTETTRDETITTRTNEYKLSLLIAQRYFDTNFRAGLIESTFGVGADQYFGKNDNYRTFIDAYDLSRDNDAMRLRIGATWRFHSNFYLIAGADDLLSRYDRNKNFFLGFGLGFSEDNIKYLAASAGGLTAFGK